MTGVRLDLGPLGALLACAAQPRAHDARGFASALADAHAEPDEPKETTSDPPAIAPMIALVPAPVIAPAPAPCALAPRALAPRPLATSPTPAPKGATAIASEAPESVTASVPESVTASATARAPKSVTATAPATAPEAPESVTVTALESVTVTVTAPAPESVTVTAPAPGAEPRAALAARGPMASRAAAPKAHVGVARAVAHKSAEIKSPAPISAPRAASAKAPEPGERAPERAERAPERAAPNEDAPRAPENEREDRAREEPKAPPEGDPRDSGAKPARPELVATQEIAAREEATTTKSKRVPDIAPPSAPSVVERRALAPQRELAAQASLAPERQKAVESALNQLTLKRAEVHARANAGELGGVEVHTRTTAGAIAIDVRAAKPEAADVLRAQLPELRAHVREGAPVWSVRVASGSEHTPRDRGREERPREEKDAQTPTPKKRARFVL